MQASFGYPATFTPWGVYRPAMLCTPWSVYTPAIVRTPLAPPLHHFTASHSATPGVYQQSLPVPHIPAPASNQTPVRAVGTPWQATAAGHWQWTPAPPPPSLPTPAAFGPPGSTPIWPPQQTPLPSEPYEAQPCFFAGAPDVFEAGTWPAQALGSETPLRLHPHIIPNPVDPTVPVLQWDIVQAAELARAVGGRNLLSTLDLMQPATTPGSRRMFITVEAPLLEFWFNRWGPIMIKKDTDITVRDVLDSIHEYFQQRLSVDDLQVLQESDPNNIELLKKAKEYRIRDSYRDLPAVAKTNTLFLRSDALGGMRRFMGLRAVIFDDGTWKAFLSLATGPVPDIVR